jgi:hypothetical protein
LNKIDSDDEERLDLAERAGRSLDAGTTYPTYTA